MQTAPSPSQQSLLLPQTRLGRYAVGFLCLAIVAFGVMVLLAATGQEGGDTFLENLWLSSTSLIAGASVITGGVLAAVAVAARGERSILCYLTILAGLFATIFIAGEFLAPH